MSRLWEIASRPFDQFRYRGDAIPDYVISTYIGDVLTTTPKPIALNPQPVEAPSPKVTVNIDNGYWAGLMPRDQTVIDFTDEQFFDWATLAAGGTQILIDKTVPQGRAWHIDNMYFFAKALGGAGEFLLGPEDLSSSLIFTVFTSSSQLGYEAYATTGLGVNTITSFPFLNDRIGPREAKFGVTLFAGEVIRAQVRARIAAGGFVIPPTYAVTRLGFRFMGVQGSRAAVEDYLRLKAWD